MSEIPDGYIIVPASAWHELVQHELKCQELAAQVEALKLPLKALLETPLGFGGSLQTDGQFAYRVRESVFKKAESALAATPQQSITEVKAQAVQDFIQFMYSQDNCQLCNSSLDIASKYADSIRKVR